MKHHRFTTIALGVATSFGLTLATPWAVAGGGGGKGMSVDEKFRSADSNSDGKLSVDEYTVTSTQMFVRIDSNQDGKVTASEMDAAHARKGEKAGKGQMSTTEKIAKAENFMRSAKAPRMRPGVMMANMH